MPYLPNVLGSWITPILFVILFAAAVIHWRRTRHWCLLALALSVLLTAGGIVARDVAMKPLIGHTAEEINSGSVRMNQILFMIGGWLSICGDLAAVVGGIGAIIWAFRQKSN